MPRILTPQEAFNCMFNEYPSLLMSSDINTAKMKFYDYIFNVIGNGYNTKIDFIKGHSYNKEHSELYNEINTKYTSDVDLYNAYTKNEHETQIGDKIVKIPNSGSLLNGLYTIKEIKNNPSIKSYVLVKKTKLLLYPNFDKKYSCIWKYPEVFSYEWLNAALWYYSTAKEYLLTDYHYEMHGAYPKEDDSPRWDRLMNDYQKAFNRYKQDNQTLEEFHTIISEKYKMEFNGDIKDFIKQRWDNTLSEYIQFIDETIEHINTFLLSPSNDVLIGVK